MIKQSLLSIALLSPSLLFGQYEITKKCFRAPESVGNVKLFYCDVDKSFAVQTPEKTQVIQKAFMDKELRNMDVRTLQKFLGAGYLSLHKMDNDEFSMKAKVRGLGGGPVAGCIAYWVTKTLCYGTAVAAAGTVVVGTGGAAGALAGGAAATMTLGASAGATVAGGAIAGAGLATEATVATAAVVSASGGIAGAITAVETASVGAGLFFGSLPFLP